MLIGALKFIEKVAAEAFLHMWEFLIEKFSPTENGFAAMFYHCIAIRKNEHRIKNIYREVDIGK